MSIQRMDNIAIVVDDLDAAIEFLTELGMELEGKGQIACPGRTTPSASTVSGATSRCAPPTATRRR
jgi:catechol 2,3-dioxygenase-like lactoylglutathione lyase family enzyme